eukprot:2669757-Rhodomonas_salina.1
MLVPAGRRRERAVGVLSDGGFERGHGGGVGEVEGPEQTALVAGALARDGGLERVPREERVVEVERLALRRALEPELLHRLRRAPQRDLLAPHAASAPLTSPARTAVRVRSAPGCLWHLQRQGLRLGRPRTVRAAPAQVALRSGHTRCG